MNIPITPPPVQNRLQEMLRQYGISEADINLHTSQSTFARQASFCALSSSYFLKLAEHRVIDPDQYAYAQSAHAHFSSLGPYALGRLATLIKQSQDTRKPSKLGQIVSEVHKIAGPHASFTLVCMLDMMIQSISHSPLPLQDIHPLISIVARHISGAPEDMLTGIATRCCYKPNPDLLRMVLSFGAIAQSCDTLGHTPLTMAANQYGASTYMSDDKAKALDCLRILLQHKAPVNGLNHQGHSALATAARSDFWQACHLLLDGGADPFIPNPDGSTIERLLAMPQTFERAHSVQEACVIAEAVLSPPHSAARSLRI